MIDFLGDVLRWLGNNWDGPAGWVHRTLEHLSVSGVALGAALVVAVPLGAWLGHTGRGAMLATSLVNIGRALPSFGIVALALPITIRLAAALPFIDSGLGFLPTAVALFALALPPLFTNTHAGIRAVDPDVVESARGMGMSGARILRSIELPLAAPLVVDAVRVTAVQVVATAPLGALVAYGGLGRFIVDGFALPPGRERSVQIFAGALLVLAVALLVDRLLKAAGRFIVPGALQRTGNTTPLGGVSPGAAAPRAARSLSQSTNREE
ncbi:MAG TPA: ABC transporter permease [Acidimicrobiia bacterium]|nr:ABC transporter permease [Acidimicrobiia bacterium]